MEIVYCILAFVGLLVFAWFLVALCMASSWPDEQMEQMTTERHNGHR